MNRSELFPTMTLLNSIKRNRSESTMYNNLVSQVKNKVNKNKTLLENSAYKRNYNAIIGGINSIRAELKKNENLQRVALAARRATYAARDKARKNYAATKIQSVFRGVMTRKRQNDNRVTKVINPNGTYSLIIKANKLRSGAALRRAKKLNLNRQLQSFAE